MELKIELIEYNRVKNSVSIILHLQVIQNIRTKL